MRALSLHEPYATLVAIGAKKWETRGRRTHVRGLIAIHATKKFGFEQFHRSTQEPFAHALEQAGISTPEGLEASLGCVVAVANIVDCITSAEWIRLYCKPPSNAAADHEYCFGDYDPGRFAWKLENVRKLRNPVPCRGGQGFWNTDRLTQDRIAAEIP